MILTGFGPGAPGHGRASQEPLLDLDAAELEACFGEGVCGVGHALADHPRLQSAAIAALADRLPTSAVERHAALQPLLRPLAAPRYGGRASNLVRELERSGWSLLLRNVERARPYGELLAAVLGELAELFGPLDGEASLILAPPLAVTPARVDAEHHLLLQISGDRELHVGRFPSPSAERRARERFRRAAHRNLESIPHDPTPIVLHAGDGVYLPPFAPHWIRTGPSASIGLALAFGDRPAA